jgi:hypothetical protein
MDMKTENEIISIIRAEEKDAVTYSGSGSAIHENRATFLDYYNQRDYGDEQPGQSSIVTGELYETIEGMLPQLMRLILQNRDIGRFTATKEEYDNEADQKTKYANYIFRRKHNATDIIYKLAKDGLLQYTGWAKVYQDTSSKVYSTEYSGVSEEEYQIINNELKSHEKIVEEVKDKKEGTYSFRIEAKEKTNTQKIDIIPPEETIIGRGARCVKDADFIGQITPKTRSQLIQMGFDKEVVSKLGQESRDTGRVKDARNWNLGGEADENARFSDKSKDVFQLGEYYVNIDIDDDGISELWQIFYCSNRILSKKRVDEHPYCVFVPIPMPHRAIGTCPAEHVYQYQFWKSTLVRQMNNNIYATNFNRMAVNENVNLDDALTLRPGGLIRVKGQDNPLNAMGPVQVMNQVPAVLEGIGYADSMLEKISGVTAYNQGMDTESLNKTATGFQGIKDMSMMRIEVIARHLSDTIAEIFKKIASLAMRYQNEDVQIRVHGEALEFNPVKMWKERDSHCDVDVGLGAGERQERIANLNYMLQMHQHFNETQNPISDYSKWYQTLDKTLQEMGIKNIENHFNNPEIPEETLMAQLQAATAQNQQMEQMLMQKNQLAEAEVAKGQMKMQEQQQKQAHDMNMKMAEMEQADQYQADKMELELSKVALAATKLEIESNRDIQGSLI